MSNDREMGMTRYIISQRHSRREEGEGTIQEATEHNSKISFCLLIFITCQLLFSLILLFHATTHRKSSDEEDIIFTFLDWSLRG